MNTLVEITIPQFFVFTAIIVVGGVWIGALIGSVYGRSRGFREGYRKAWLRASHHAPHIFNGCAAVQYSDQMVCDQCAVAWDVNDTDPPRCVVR